MPLILSNKTFRWLKEYKSLHKLRHAFASVSGQNGVPPELMRDTLGHFDIRNTLETYTHVFEDKQKDQQLQDMHCG